MYDPLLYWEERAQHWLDNEIKPTDDWWPDVKKLVDPTWSVLELGCGNGRWSERFPIYTGADISPKLILAAKKNYPDKRWAHHDMRKSVTGKWDLIFTSTAWLHVPPADIKTVSLPDTRLLFIEPHGPGNNLHCFQHDYEQLFGAKPIKTVGPLTMYWRDK